MIRVPQCDRQRKTCFRLSMRLFVRIARGWSVWEKDDLQEIFETEFEPSGKLDLNPSVYELDSEEFVLQAFTEHKAGCETDPRSGGGIDFSAGTCIKTLGTSRFQFTRER